MPPNRRPGRRPRGLGAVVYRRFVLEHPSLFRIAFQRVAPWLEMTDARARGRAEESLGRLEHRVSRVEEIGALQGRSVRAAAVEFNAMCEGLANAELRGGTMRALPRARRSARGVRRFETVVRGLTTGT